MTPQPKDRFSTHAASYAAFRPTYPQELYDFIFAHVINRESAWDCGTGNGQVARDLAKTFRKVWATDISEQQIENALKLVNIDYAISPAHKTILPDFAVDLITVGQAVHWFDIPAFYKEVGRVAKKGAILAVWGYGLLGINPEIDLMLNDFYVKKIGPYWDSERKLVDDRYQSIPFPFQEIKTPDFTFSFNWTIEQLQGYLSTWSSVQKYIRSHGTDPVKEFMEMIRPLWKSERMKMVFPLFMRMGRVLT